LRDIPGKLSAKEEVVEMVVAGATAGVGKGAGGLEMTGDVAPMWGRVVRFVA
jgi:hypothetical protein